MNGIARWAMLAILATEGAIAEIPVRNGGFEDVPPGQDFPVGWHADIGGGAQGRVVSDTETMHSGGRAVRIENQSPQQAFVYASFYSDPIAVDPQVTYTARFFAKGRRARRCFFSAGFSGDGDQRQYLPDGDFDWREFPCTFTTPDGCRSATLRFASDDVTNAFWVDDVALEVAPRQLVNLEERRYPKDFDGVFPRSKGRVAKRLLVYDCTREPDDSRLALAALQGIVNRIDPSLYLIHPTNPAYYDEVWLEYMQEKRYTHDPVRVATAPELIARFRAEINGVIIYDPDLPGSVNAACMLAGVLNALPVSPTLVTTLRLPVVMDLRGRWRRNVDAYRFVYDHYWDRMNHHVLAWIHPSSTCHGARDYLTEFNVFCFWISNYADQEPGADPAEEVAFAHELLAATPANIPVMGWPAYGDTKGIAEYTGVRLLSEYGKFVPGTEFCTNLSVHTAIHPKNHLFRQPSSRAATSIPLDAGKVYLSVNVMDSGDALWYWQLHQRKIWADPVRGTAPIGWCMNVTLYDTLPLVLEWYYEHATPNDTFFAAASGLGYMNTQVYASRFRAADRERIWRDYVKLTDRYCRRLDIDGIEMYNGSWGEPSPPSRDTFRRFTRGMKHLNYVLADLGRHNNINAANANYLLDDTAVFHTLTRFQVWSSSAEVLRDDMAKANEWLQQEILTNAPTQRPGFMSAMAISWYYFPSWIRDLQAKLPPDYVVVGPNDLARLFKQQAGTKSGE